MNFDCFCFFKKVVIIFFSLYITNYAYAKQVEQEGDNSSMISLKGLFSDISSFNRELNGGKHEYTIKNMSDNIISEDITSFKYNTVSVNSLIIDENNTHKTYKDFGIEHCFFTFSVKAVDEGKYFVEASGNNNETKRDGKRFILKYSIQDSNFVNELQNIVKKHSLSKNNGHVNIVSGLPSGDGDILSIKYISGESIYKQNNQGVVISMDATADIYKAFKNNAIQQGYDFTTEKSNVKVYNDPTEDMLQGTWKGTHFGHDCVVVISGKHIKIYYNGILTDDTDYVIDEGTILTNKNDGTRHLPFNGITSLSKVNDFTLSGYVYKDKSSSNFRLLKQKSEQ